MNTTHHVFLSPHLDDVALSCGGMLHQLVQSGQTVQVITVFAGDPPSAPLTPFAHRLHERWQTDPVGRRAEDIEALRCLGAEGTHWPYPDAVYRRDPLTGMALYATEESIFGAMVAADAGTVASIAQPLSRIDPTAQVIAPLSAGHHVDHQLLRAAGEALGRELSYYEDYPYVETPERIEAVLRVGRWAAKAIPLSEEAIRAKVAAILAYRSQLSTFFADATEVEPRIRAYAQRVGGEVGPAERLWRVC
ncbi:MAG TPA: PIG-L family deacetylase [Anaerolineae bacterium]|nr:PIG-L family deacetylase [Anaerolineae bacterium]